jgi:hypothetical protein
MFNRSATGRAALVLGLWAWGAQADTTDCTSLPEGFVLCAQSTTWANAEVIAFDNGVAFDLDPYWLEVFPAPEPVSSVQPFDAALEAMIELIAEQARNEGLGVPETLTRDSFETEHAQFVMLTTRIELPEDDPMVYMTMIAQANDARIVLTIDSAIATSVDGVPKELRDLADMIRPQEM